jgi:hypothetical protein
VIRALIAAVVLAGGAAPAGAAVPRLGHVFVIVGENTSPSALTSARAPYLTRRLRPRAAWTTSYRAFHGSKSLGQYMGLITGRYTPCDARDGEPSECRRGSDNLFSQLTRSGRTWNEWDESAETPCDTHDNAPYVAHHAPAVYLSGLCADGHDLPMGTTQARDTSALDARLATGDVGDFNLLIPNNCENGHDACGGDPVRAFDRFLAREVPKIEASPAFRRDGTLFVVWDEGGDAQPDRVALFALGAHVRPGRRGGGPYTHYSLLRTLEDGYGLAHLGHARDARSITSIWR